MKNLRTLTLITLIFGIIFGSCNKPTENIQKVESFIEFSFSLSPLKSGYVQGLTNVVVTIEDLQGNVIKNMEKVEIYSMNEYYLSKPISILTGDYKLTSFIVLDADNNVVYASPVEGSEKAYLVENPLPLEFKVQKDNVTKLVPEVLSTAESLPEDFGYSTFGFEISQTFDFLVGAFIYNETVLNFELTTATISVYNNEDLVYTGELQANGGISPDNYDPLGITNKITLPERFESFIVEITKEGYIGYSKTFTKEELRLHFRNEDKGPLVVILEANTNIPGLVAYYPFNGNVNDVSGNDYHGIDYGAAGYLSSNFELARTFTNDPTVGVNATDYVEIPNVINSDEFSVSLWANLQYNGNHQTLIYLSTGRDWVSANFFFIVDKDMKLVVCLNGLDLRSIDYSHQAMLNGQFNDAYLNSNPLEMNKYSNIICTFGNSVITLYVDGVEYAKYLDVNEVVGSPAAAIKLGVSAYPTPGIQYYPLVGQMDEVRFYNRAITAGEVQMLNM